MKRIIAILLVLVMACTLLACGTKEDGGTTPPSDSGTQTPDTSDSSTPNLPATDTEVSAPADIDGKEYGGIMRIISTAEGSASLGIPTEVFGIDVNLLIPYLESLVMEKSNGEIVPLLATDYEVDVDNLELRFTLREGVKFTDGSDFNAEVAAWNLQMAIDAQLMNPAITGVTVTGDYSITVTLSKWSNTLMSGFASHSFGMISKEAYEQNGADWARENPVGTGPFIFDKYVHGEKISYIKNENYWQEGKPYLDGIEYIFIRDVMTQNAAMQATGEQEISVLNTTSGEQIVSLQGLDVHIESMPSGPITLMPSSNNPDSPFAKLEVRQAMSYAINRDALVAARGFGILDPALQLVPDTWGAHLPDSYNASYDPDKARELLTQAGYPDGFKSKLIGMPGTVDKDMVVAIQSMLAEVGIECEVEFPDQGGYSNYRFNGWDGMLVQIMRSFQTIQSTFVLFFDVKLNEETGEYYYQYMPSTWRPNEELYLAEEAAGLSPEPDDKLLQDVHRIMMENMIAIPLYNVYDLYVIKNNVHDTGFSELGQTTIYAPAEAWMSSN